MYMRIHQHICVIMYTFTICTYVCCRAHASYVRAAYNSPAARAAVACADVTNNRRMQFSYIQRQRSTCARQQTVARRATVWTWKTYIYLFVLLSPSAAHPAATQMCTCQFVWVCFRVFTCKISETQKARIVYYAAACGAATWQIYKHPRESMRCRCGSSRVRQYAKSHACGAGGTEAYNVMYVSACECVCCICKCIADPADDEIRAFLGFYSHMKCSVQKKYNKKLQILRTSVARIMPQIYQSARGRDELWNSTMHTIRRVSLLIVMTRKLLSARTRHKHTHAMHMRLCCVI